MRNLKKVLSLTLALVMLLGMMVVGAGAAEYADAGEIEYKEAADVLNAIGVMQGDENGNLNPKDELNRVEGAAIVYRMLTGGMTQNPSGGATGFVDVDGVANYSWATGIIADLAGKGIIAGEDATHFNPSGKLTGAAFGKMLLVALGYNADTQGYVGGGWEGNVIRDAYSNGITVTGVVMTNSITREQAAQMSLNTLQAPMVYQKGGIQIGDVVIPGDRPEKIDGAGANSNKDFRVNETDDDYVEFCESYFPGLKLTAGTETDDFDRPINVWAYNDETVATASTVDTVVTYTSKKSAADVAKDLKGYKLYIDLNTGSDDYKAVNNTTTYAAADKGKAYDGSTTSELLSNNKVAADLSFSANETIASAIAGETENGKLVEIYANGNKEITKIVTVAYTVEKVRSVTEKDDVITYAFTTSGSFKNDEDATNAIIEGTVEKDDLVTTAVVGDKIYVYPTTSFTGVQTSFSSSKKTIVVDGTTYTVKAGLTVDGTEGNFPNSSEEATFYQDQYDFVVGSDVAEVETSWAVVNDIAAVGGNGGLSSNQSVEAQLFFADGTKANVKVVKIGNAAVGQAAFTITNNASTSGAVQTIASDKVATVTVNTDSSKNGALKGRIVKYSVSNDEYTLDYVNLDNSGTDKFSATTTGAVKSSNGSNTATVITKGVPSFNVAGTDSSYTKTTTANNNTIYIVKKDANTFASYTGFRNVPGVSTKDSSTGVRVTYAMDGTKVAIVYVDATASNSSVDDGASGDIFYVTNTDYTTEGAGSNTVYVLQGVLNGEPGEIRSKTQSVITGLSKGDLKELTVDSDGLVTATNNPSYTNNDIDASEVENGGIVAGGYTYTDDSKFYVIDGSDVDVGDAKSVEAGDKVLVKTKGSTAGTADALTIDVMYIVKGGAARAKNVLKAPTKPANATDGLTIASVVVTKDDANKTAVAAEDELTAGTYRVVVTLSGTVTGDPSTAVKLGGVAATGTATVTDATKLTNNTSAAAATANTFTLVKDAAAAAGTEIVFKFTVTEAAAGTGDHNITPAITIAA